MAYKQFDDSMSFTELAFASSMEKNRALDLMNSINAVVDWTQIEELLIKYYKFGKGKEGGDAYSPLLLLKCLLLQKWFRISSDPEVETQINAALTEYEIQRNKIISKVRYKIKQYFGITEKNTTGPVKTDLQLS